MVGEHDTMALINPPFKPVHLIIRFFLSSGLVLTMFLSVETQVGLAAAYPSPGPLLHRSLTVMQHSVHQVHGAGAITTGACCPKTPAMVRLAGDCTSQPSRVAIQATVHGTMSFDAKSIVVVDFRAILISNHSPPSIGVWTRSSATHNTWQIATKATFPTRDMDLVTYLCPGVLVSEFSAHPPAHLVNLGPTTVNGVFAWHLRDRIAVTRGGMKGTVLQSDFYLAQSSLYWLRYASLHREPGFDQDVDVTYSRLNVPVTIAPPAIDSSVP